MNNINKILNKLIRNEEGEVVSGTWEKERCLIRDFFENEAKKPIYRQQKLCMISCPCSQCKPGHL